MRTIYVLINWDFYEWRPGLGNSIHNIAIQTAPIETGNLRSAIYLNRNDHFFVEIVYDLQKARYAEYLNKGIGRNKKHVDFIDVDTVWNIAGEIIRFEKTGKMGASESPAKVYVRTGKARNYERDMLKKAGFSQNIRVSAKERELFSRHAALSKRSGHYLQKSQRIKVSANAYKPEIVGGKSPRFMFIGKDLI